MASLLSMICFVAYAQQTVTGTVKDATGEPMIGVTVLLNGQAAAVTDIDGNFSIKAEPKDVVKVSYIGYTDQQITVGNKTSLDIVLQEDSQTLNEVVVVGYGTMKKSDLTGSVSSVDTEKLNAKGAASVMGNLQGANPGVNITQSSGRAGSDFNIEIRGKSSINSDTTPLYVVDGVICSDIQWLNPQDIERIDVLKDASSTAIYGSRATAGVVMVTTKSGTTVKDSFKESKPTISYDGYYGWVKTARMPKFQDAGEFYRYRFARQTAYGGNGSLVETANPVYVVGANALSFGYILNDDGIYAVKDMLQRGESYDWPGLVTRNGSQQNHFLSVNGGGQNINYHFGAGYNQEKGIYKGDDQRRFNFKGSVDAKLNKIISAGFSVNVANIHNDYANDDAIKYAYRMNPFMRPFKNDGTTYHQPGYVDVYNSAGTGNNFTKSLNPLDVMNSTKKERETWRMLGNFYLKFDIIKGLDFKTTFSPNYTYYREGFFGGYVNPATNTPWDDDTYNTTDNKNEAKLTTNRGFSWTWDNIINYNTRINDIHNIGVMGLFSMMSSNTEKTVWAATNVMENTDWWNLNSGTYNANGSSNSYTENSMISYALRANYGLLDRYLLTATVRWDGSSKFAKDNRWGAFPSVALAWRASEEEFLKKIGWISNLKLRLSYGVTGNNDGISNYATQQTVSGPIYYPYGTVYSQGFYPSSIVNKDLKWEKSHEINFGVDFGFLNNRINGSVDIYQKTSKDLLYEVALPLESGGGTMVTNIGSVRNRGVEISLNTVNIQTKDWNWETTLTFAHNKNEVREINGTGNRVISESLTTGSLFVGESVNNVYGFEWAGIVSDRDMVVPNNKASELAGLTPGTVMKEYDYYFQTYKLKEGQPIIADTNNDGEIDNRDRVVKSSDPKWTGSFTSNLSYKNWDFSFSLYAKVGGKVYSNFLSEYLNIANDRGRMRLNEDWYIPAGTLIDCDGVNADGTYINPVYQTTTHYGDYPYLNYAGSNGGVGALSTYWDNAKCIVDGSFLKVKNITLGYTFPKEWINKFGCSHLRLYFTVTNPFVITKYQGFDPEWANASLKNDGPSTVTYQIGASIKF